jgi:hypothetical protein
VLVVPNVTHAAEQHGIDDFALTPALKATIMEELDRRRLLGTTVELSTPFYQGVTVAALVRASHGHPPEHIQRRALELLNRFVNPLLGGLDGEGWPFDEDLNGAVIAQLLETIEGLERVDDVLLFEYDLRTGRRDGPGRPVIHLDPNSLFVSAFHRVVVR